MQGSLVDLVLFPRFTGLVGSGSYASVPVGVSEYSSVVLEAVRGGLLGGTSTPVAATFSLAVEESHDGVVWETLESTSTPAASSVWPLALSRRWLRVVVTLVDGSDDEVAITLYVTGTLTRRVAGVGG